MPKRIKSKVQVSVINYETVKNKTFPIIVTFLSKE